MMLIMSTWACASLREDVLGAAPTTALVMLSELLFASLSSVAAGAAELSMRTLAGGALILAAAIWPSLSPPQPTPGSGPAAHNGA